MIRVAVLAFAVVLLAGCVSERGLELVIEPPRDMMGGPDVPAEAVSWEVRVVRLGDDDACPGVDASAEARAFGELADAQSFAVDGSSTAVGELPSGRWAFAALARDAACQPLLYGCAIVTLDATATTLVVPVEAVSSTSACGCRACDAGSCAEVERICG